MIVPKFLSHTRTSEAMALNSGSRAVLKTNQEIADLGFNAPTTSSLVRHHTTTQWLKQRNQKASHEKQIKDKILQ